MNGRDERNLSVTDVRVFVPSRDFEVSNAFYAALGFATIWNDDTLALLELGGHRIMLQNYFVKAWAENFMIVIEVEDADAWYAQITDVLRDGAFGDARVAEPEDQDWGARVTYVWDPCGVLIHFTQWLNAPAE
jgi:uncharacterized glyoxalase superfamily protein PhnB